jgi:type II secretion system protein E
VATTVHGGLDLSGFAASCDPRELGRLLLANRLLTADQLAEGEARSQATGEALAESLVRQRAVSIEDVLQAVALHYQLPYLFRGELPVPAPIVPNVSPKYLRQYVVCPVSIEGNVLTVASADPLNPVVADDLRQSTGLQIRVAVSPPVAILEAIDRTYQGASTALQRIVEGVDEDRVGDDQEDVAQLRDMAFEAPVVRLVNLLIEGAIAAEASDVHIEPFEDTLRVRYRIDGVLFDQESPPRRLRDAVTSRIKLMAEMNIAERRLPQDGRIRVSIRDRRVDIRVSTVPTVHGESIVMRLLDRSSVFLPLERLGFESATHSAFESLIARPHGIVLVTGPTGSGKTTTLYAALDKINSPDRKIITIEDPVEYQLKGVNQIPVKAKVGLTFATGLRHIVRQDPDVILIGEIRDLETVEIAIQASLTGHLVFSTLHTNDAPGAIPRLQDMGAEPYLIASVLEGVLAQRLVRRVCASCRVPETPSPADLEALGVEAEPGLRVWRGKGCEGCRNTGYRGRVGIYELFPVTEDVRSLILRRAPSHELRRHAVQMGMTTLRLDGWVKARQGLTTMEEVLRVTQEDA